MTDTVPMPSRQQLAGASALLLLLAACATGCRGRAAPEPAVESPILRVGFGIGPSGKAMGLEVLTQLLYTEPLVSHDWTGRPREALAETFVWEDDHKTLRLRLKEAVKFHDGTPLTSDVVVRFLEQKSEGRLGFVYVTDISAPDPRTVLIRLSRPDMFLLPELTDMRMTHPDAPEIATGPFKLVSRKPVVQTLRFDNYHNGRSALGGVRFVTYDSHRSAWAALLRNEVDVVQEISRESAEFLEGSSSAKTFRSLQPFYMLLSFNQGHPVLKHAEVRRALSQALDRQAIVDHELRGRGRVADGPFWPLHWAYTPLTDAAAHDPDGARARLDGAGFPVPKTARAGERRARFKFKCLVWTEDPQHEGIAQMVQRQLFNVGVDMEIEPVTLETFMVRAEKGAFDAYLMQANAGRALDYTYRTWRSPGAANKAMQKSGYAGADAALDRLRHSTSDDDIRAALAAAMRQFRDDAPAAFIAWMEITRAVDTRFKVDDSQSQDPFATMWRWKPAGKPDRQ